MNDFVIETAGLCKSFKGKPALNGLDFKVPAGSIFGFLGRNGAGKTTTIKLLLGMLHSDSGVAKVFGFSVSAGSNAIAARRRIGFVSEEKELYPYMTVEQVIRFTRPFFRNGEPISNDGIWACSSCPRTKRFPTYRRACDQS